MHNTPHRHTHTHTQTDTCLGGCTGPVRLGPGSGTGAPPPRRPTGNSPAGLRRCGEHARTTPRAGGEGAKGRPLPPLPHGEDGARRVQVLLRPGGRDRPIGIVVAGQRLLLRLGPRGALLEVPGLHDLKPLEDLGGDLHVATGRVAVGVPVGDQALEEPLPMRQGLRLGHAERVRHMVQRLRECGVALGYHLPAGHLTLAVVVVAIHRGGNLALWPAVDPVEPRLGDVLAGGGQHPPRAEQRRCVRVLLHHGHVVRGVVVVDLDVAEGAAAHVHVYLRVVEEHLDDLAGPVLRRRYQGRDLLEELEPGVRDDPRVLADVDVVGVGALDLEHLPHLEHVVPRRVVEDLGHLAHREVCTRGDGLRQLGGHGAALPQAHPAEGLDDPAVLLVRRLAEAAGQVGDLGAPYLPEVAQDPPDQGLPLALLEEQPVAHHAVEGVAHDLPLRSDLPRVLCRVAGQVRHDHGHPLPLLALDARGDELHDPVGLPDQRVGVVELPEGVVPEERHVLEEELVGHEGAEDPLGWGLDDKGCAVHLAAGARVRARRERAPGLRPVRHGQPLVGHEGDRRGPGLADDLVLDLNRP
mmetsp:Transcript_29864/g.94188  ORF Transcript_29864/g.94188 Transcript_29864/m.94188 type:complete len:581 (+) Transcript_29864:3-1745(+)